MTLDLTPLEKACSSLQEAISNASDQSFIANLSESQRKLIIAGVIQNFEFTYELCWKFIKRWLTENIGKTYVEGVTRRELFRLAATNKLIDNVDNWMFYHQARNQTSHIYDEVVANEVFNAAKSFSQQANELLASLAKRND